jgi:enterochelin esterase-like enzyme
VVTGSFLPIAAQPAFRRRALLAGATASASLLVAAGLLGVYRYVDNYWLYRGFPPPREPAFVPEAGVVQRLYVTGRALGGRHQPVDVYLPPGYAADPHRRYPVLYLLHGFPGRPDAFLMTVRAGVVEDILLATHKIQPLILVMPFGSTGTFTDKEWANGIRPHEAWETFVSRDLVRAIDARYRTIPDGSARGLGGLSEGAYGALNIGLHHPGEFRVLESWSGYEKAADVKAIFGGKPKLLRWNSPLVQLPRVAPAMRRKGAFFWLYSGSDDGFRSQNAAFAAELRQARIPHRYFVVRGGHNWAIWRGEVSLALIAASKHLGDV